MSASPNVDPAFTRRLYGRRQGHALRQGQATLVEELLPQVAVPEEGALTAEHLFGSARPMQFEIGFGGGEHMAAPDKAHPCPGFIGCEPFLNGVDIGRVTCWEKSCLNSLIAAVPVQLKN